MTKAELIKALQDLKCPDDWKVYIVQNQWVPGYEYPLERQFVIDQVCVTGQYEIGIDFYCNEPTTDDEP